MKYSKLTIDYERKFRLPIFDAPDHQFAEVVKNDEKRSMITDKNVVVRPSANIQDLVKSDFFRSSSPLPKISKRNIFKPKRSFYQRVSEERKSLKAKRLTVENKPSGITKKNIEDPIRTLKYHGEMISPDYVINEIIRTFGFYFRVWQRKALLELALFCKEKLSPEVYLQVPHILSIFRIKRYQKGVVELISACEKTLGLEILSFDEKAKLLSSRISYVTITQIALNRLWYLREKNSS